MLFQSDSLVKTNYLPIYVVIACEDMHYGHGCANLCTCNTTNTALCDNVDGSCTCKAGWEGNTCNDDINECEASVKYVTCNDDRLECINIAGSFRCDCKEGFYKLDGKCTGKREHKKRVWIQYWCVK